MSDAFAEAIGLTKVVDPRQRPAARQRPGVSTRRKQRSRSRQPKDAFEEAITPVTPQQQAEPAQATPQQPVEQPPAAPGIDFDAPVPEVRKAIDALPEDQQQAAIDEWAKRYVAKERKNNEGWTQIAQDRVRDLARGTPVGSWLDEANAGTSHVLHSLGLGGAPYREAKAYQDAMDEAADNESTKQFSLPYLGDVHTSGLTKLAGGLASVRATPMLSLFRGSTILPQMGNAMATGLGYGTLYGAGQGNSAEERATNAAIGGGAGMAFGAAVPLGIHGGKAVANALTPKSTPKAVSGYHPGAVKRLERSVADDLLSPSGNARAYTAQAGKLGEKGTLADMGTNLIGQADAIANQPGKGKAIIRGALRARTKGSSDRINQATNRALGPDVDGDTLVNNYVKQSQDAARPLYKQFRETPVDLTPRIRRIVNRVRSLPGLSNIDETIAKRFIADDVPADVIENNGLVLDYMKKAVDAVANKAARDGDKGLAGTASRIARDLRNAVDKSMFPNNPKGSLYAQAREEARRGITFEKGYQEGKKILNNKTSAGRMRIDNQSRTPEGLDGLKAGAREDIRQKMYTAKSAFDDVSQRKAEATAGRRLLSSEETRGKLQELVGPDAARDLTRTLDAEGQMAGVTNAITGNSATAGRLQAQKEFPNAVSVNAGQAANELGKKNFTGLLMEGGYRILNFVMDGTLDEQRMLIARDAAEMLVAQGAKRDEIAKALIQGAQRSVKSEAHREAIMGLAQQIIRGGTPASSREAIAGFNG